MCRLCDQGRPPLDCESRRDFLKASFVAGAAAVGVFAATGVASAQETPSGTGEEGRRVLIKGGHVLSMDPEVGDFAEADVLVIGRHIEAIGPNLDASDAEVIDAIAASWPLPDEHSRGLPNGRPLLCRTERPVARA